MTTTAKNTATSDPQGHRRPARGAAPRAHRARHSPVVRHEVFQTSLMSALLDGIYDGDMTLAEQLGHGNFGLGTFEALDGEMIILDSVPWQLRVDGSVTRASLDQLTPFATVTNFVPSISEEIKGPLTRAELSELVDHLGVSANYLYGLRITGDFEWITTRTVRRQKRPFPPMSQTTSDEPVVRQTQTSGVMAGFRTPLFEQGINVAGCHVHYVNNEHTHGGHVVDFVMNSGLIEVCLGTDLRVRLPLSEAFQDADLAPDDLDEQVRAAEHH